MIRGGFDKRQIRDFVKAAKQRAGRGWDLLGPDLQEGLVAREACSVILSQALVEKYGPAQELIKAMFAAFRGEGQ